jgi:hypothetical protein
MASTTRSLLRLVSGSAVCPALAQCFVVTVAFDTTRLHFASLLFLQTANAQREALGAHSP